MKETRICPACGREYDDYPALSRRDNETEICPQCGINEVLEDYFKHSCGKEQRNENYHKDDPQS